jgi:hypothetical protein
MNNDLRSMDSSASTFSTRETLQRTRGIGADQNNGIRFFSPLPIKKKIIFPLSSHQFEFLIFLS